MTRHLLRGPLAACLFAAALAVDAGPVSGLQDQSTDVGEIEGFVYDSTMGEPLRDATVALWETTFRTRTDNSGRFLLTDVPVGEYAVVFFHPRLGNLGLGSGSVQVEVIKNLTSSVRLATPSMTTVLTNECLLETGDPSATNIIGYAADGGSGVGMPGAKIRLRWWDKNQRLGRRDVETNSEGWYRVCGVEEDLSIAANASFLSMNSTRREFTTAASFAHRIDFLLGSYSASRISGTLTDQATEDAIMGAEIRLRGTDFFTTTSQDGKFSFVGVPPGEYTVQVDHIAYAPRAESVDVGSDLAVHLAIAMTAEAFELPPIVVTVDQNVLDQRLAMGGTLITSDELEPLKMRSNTLADLLQYIRVPGLLVRRTEGQLCAEFASGTVRLMRFEQCANVMMYIDGARVADPTAILDLQDDIIDRIVVFRPIEAGSLFGIGAAQGVMMVYTKTGQNRQRP